MSNSKISPHDYFPDFCQSKGLLWLTLFSQSLVVVLILLSSDIQNFGWERFALLAFYVQWTVLTCAAILCRVRQHGRGMTVNQLMWLGFIIMVGTNVLISIFAQWGMNAVFYQPLGFDWVVRNALISAILAALLLHYFYVQMQNKLHARSEMQARVQALQSRIQPHFLFNSMNIIASLIHEDPDRAEQAVEDLSELFRASLKEAGVQVPLSQEIDLCKTYLNIELLRLGSRLHVEWNVNASMEAYIPLLTIQPLLENAVYHGIAPNPEPGTISITIEQKQNNKGGSKLSIVVVNSHNPNLCRSSDEGNRMALNNIEHRLQALYGDSAVMTAHHTQQSYHIYIEYSLPNS